jgi:hypothetical protein
MEVGNPRRQTAHSAEGHLPYGINVSEKDRIMAPAERRQPTKQNMHAKTFFCLRFFFLPTPLYLPIPPTHPLKYVHIIFGQTYIFVELVGLGERWGWLVGVQAKSGLMCKHSEVKVKSTLQTANRREGMPRIDASRKRTCDDYAKGLLNIHYCKQPSRNNTHWRTHKKSSVARSWL